MNGHLVVARLVQTDPSREVIFAVEPLEEAMRSADHPEPLLSSKRPEEIL